MLQSRGDELKRGSKSSLLPKNEIPENISLNSDHNLNSLHKRLPNRDAFPGTYSCHHLGLLACAVETESCKTCKIPTLSQTKDLRPSQNHIKYQESKKIFESFESMTKDQQNKSELQNSLISKRNSKTETLHKYKDQITRRRRRPNWNHFDEESEIRQMQQNLLVGIEPDVMPTHPIMFFPANPDITATSRCTLINWLLEVVLHFRLHRETLYLAIHMIDRYMSVCPGVRRSFYQLLGVTALFVASKLEEVYSPKIGAFSELCNGSCPVKEIHRTELALLDALDWRIGVPTTLYWLGLYLDLLEFSIAEHCTDGHVMRIETVRKRAIAILDLVMHTPTQFSFPYSMVAAAAISLQLNDERLVTACTAFFPEQLRICVSWMLGLYYACPETIVFLSPKSPIDDGCRDSNNHEGRISFLNNSCNNDSSNLPTTTRLDASSAHLDDTDELVGSDENFEDDEFERAISTNSRVMAYLMEGMQSNQF